jgi:hypothetical protein
MQLSRSPYRLPMRRSDRFEYEPMIRLRSSARCSCDRAISGIRRRRLFRCVPANWLALAGTPDRGSGPQPVHRARRVPIAKCLVLWGVAVEKVLRAKLAKNKIALGCSTNDVLNFLGILYPPIFGCLEETGLFQQPHLLAPSDEEPLTRPYLPSRNKGDSATLSEK